MSRKSISEWIISRLKWPADVLRGDIQKVHDEFMQMVDSYANQCVLKALDRIEEANTLKLEVEPNSEKDKLWATVLNETVASQGFPQSEKVKAEIEAIRSEIS